MKLDHYYGGAYKVDPAGRWCYVLTNQRVPGAESMVDALGRVQMNAPELLAHQMIDTREVARMLGIAVTSVTVLLSRGNVPKPQLRAGNSPLWSRPVIEQWRARRPGKGANFRNRGKAA